MEKTLKKKFTKARLNIWTGILATVFLCLDYLTGFAIIHFRSLGWLIPKPTAFLLHHWLLPFLTFFLFIHLLISFDIYFLSARVKNKRIRRAVFWSLFSLSVLISTLITLLFE